MAWKLPYDYINVRIVPIRLDQENEIENPTFNYNRFSKDWYFSFKKILDEISIEVERDFLYPSYLVYFKDIHKLTKNPHEDTSGLQKYINTVLETEAHWAPHILDNYAVLFEFED